MKIITAIDSPASGYKLPASWGQGEISPHRVVLHNYGHYGIFMPSRHPALASGGDRILGWKDYQSVQLKQFLCPNTKLMVLSLRLHATKLPALCTATGRAKVRLKTHFFPTLLNATQPSDPTQAYCPTYASYRHPTLSGDQHVGAGP